jgi:hypothetical protein
MAGGIAIVKLYINRFRWGLNFGFWIADFGIKDETRI